MHVRKGVNKLDVKVDVKNAQVLMANDRMRETGRSFLYVGCDFSLLQWYVGEIPTLVNKNTKIPRYSFNKIKLWYFVNTKVRHEI